MVIGRNTKNSPVNISGSIQANNSWKKNYLFQIHFENTCIDDDDADNEATAAIDDDDDGGYDGLEICKYLLSKDYKILISPGKNKFYHAF